MRTIACAGQMGASTSGRAPLVAKASGFGSPRGLTPLIFARSNTYSTCGQYRAVHGTVGIMQISSKGRTGGTSGRPPGAPLDCTPEAGSWQKNLPQSCLNPQGISIANRVVIVAEMAALECIPSTPSLASYLVNGSS